MKTRFVSLALLVSAMAVAQSPAPPLPSRTLLKLSPQHFVASTLQIVVEQFNPDFSRSWNVSIGVRYQENNRGQGREHQGEYIQGADVNIQYRFYVRPIQIVTSPKNRQFAQGLYVGPFLNAGMYEVDDEGYRMSSSSPGNFSRTAWGNRYNTRHLAGGLTVGLQRTFWKVMMVDVFAGGAFRYCDVEMVSNQVSTERAIGVLHPGFHGFFPRIGFNLGITL